MSEQNKINKLFWVDLEMSGLDVEKEVIIEVAGLFTDIHLKVISPTYHTVVKQPQKYIDEMDAWNKQHHGSSGLIDKIPTGKDPKLVEDELISFLHEHQPEGQVVLAGNSIGQDRKFIDFHWKQLSEKLHYRMLDVTAWKIIYENKYGVIHEKKDAHRATDDILESIDELKTYIMHINL